MSIQTEILRAIYSAIESKLHLIGSVIEGKTRRLILEKGIKDRGDFYQNTSYAVNFNNSSIDLAVGSNVPHEQYVLGGKVPSWTPIQPLKDWVARKGLDWVDKITGEQLTIENIAYMIRAKIKRQGVPERNVFAEVIHNQEKWIFDQLDSIEVVL